jgi:hypothetical protein
METTPLGQSPPPTCSVFPKDVLRDLAFRIERLTKWGNEFEKCKDRCAPGFQLPHECRLYKHFWIEIEDQIEEIASELRDNRGMVMTYVHSGGCVQVKGSPIINTAKRLVDYLAKS